MPDIVFDAQGFLIIRTELHGEVRFSKEKWDKICGEPERWYYRFNGEKVGTTLVNPDLVRQHQHISSQYLYYKAYSTFVLAPNVTVNTGRNFPPYFAVVIDTNTGRVCTVYPVPKPKPGKVVKGK